MAYEKVVSQFSKKDMQTLIKAAPYEKVRVPFNFLLIFLLLKRLALFHKPTEFEMAVASNPPIFIKNFKYHASKISLIGD